jgi:hypothetical protein
MGADDRSRSRPVHFPGGEFQFIATVIGVVEGEGEGA